MKYFVSVILVLAMMLVATSAMAAYIEAWEMDVDMTAAGSGTINGYNMSVVPYAGSGTNGPTGFSYDGGIATFLDDGASSGNQGIFLGTSLLDGGYTFDMRIKWLQGVTGVRSMGFAGAGGVGRGMGIYSDNLSWSTSGIAGWGNGVNLTEWQNLRVVVQSSGLFSVYLLGSDTAIMSTTSAGSTPTADVLSTAGWILGSNGGSSTTLTNYQLDWVRVATGIDVLADHNVPEPGSMMALATGLVGMAGFAIRRRRS